MEATQEQPPSEQVLRQGYEPSTLSVKGVLVFLFFFFVTAIVVHYGAWFLEEHLLNRPRSAEAILTAVPAVRQFPEPDVQPSQQHNRAPWEDMAALRQAEAARFEQLGWKADPQTGSARIPDSVIDLLSERYKTKAAGKSLSPPASEPSATQPATLPGVQP